MGSMFESMVYARSQHTPWASVDFLRFAKEMCWHGTDNPLDNQVILSINYRHNVASRYWFELQWTGADHERHSVEAQTFDKLMWRAAEVEVQVERKIHEQAGQAKSSP